MEDVISQEVVLDIGHFHIHGDAIVTGPLLAETSWSPLATPAPPPSPILQGTAGSSLGWGPGNPHCRPGSGLGSDSEPCGVSEEPSNVTWEAGWPPSQTHTGVAMAPKFLSKADF